LGIDARVRIGHFLDHSSFLAQPTDQVHRVVSVGSFAQTVELVGEHVQRTRDHCSGVVEALDSEHKDVVFSHFEVALGALVVVLDTGGVQVASGEDGHLLVSEVSQSEPDAVVHHIALNVLSDEVDILELSNFEDIWRSVVKGILVVHDVRAFIVQLEPEVHRELSEVVARVEVEHEHHIVAIVEELSYVEVLGCWQIGERSTHQDQVVVEVLFVLREPQVP
jgi:hypothetical protein